MTTNSGEDMGREEPLFNASGILLQPAVTSGPRLKAHLHTVPEQPGEFSSLYSGEARIVYLTTEEKFRMNQYEADLHLIEKRFLTRFKPRN